MLNNNAYQSLDNVQAATSCLPLCAFAGAQYTEANIGELLHDTSRIHRSVHPTAMGAYFYFPPGIIQDTGPTRELVRYFLSAGWPSKSVDELPRWLRRWLIRHAGGQHDELCGRLPQCLPRAKTLTFPFSCEQQMWMCGRCAAGVRQMCGGCATHME